MKTCYVDLRMRIRFNIFFLCLLRNINCFEILRLSSYCVVTSIHCFEFALGIRMLRLCISLAQFFFYFLFRHIIGNGVDRNLGNKLGRNKNTITFHFIILLDVYESSRQHLPSFAACSTQCHWFSTLFFLNFHAQWFFSNYNKKKCNSLINPVFFSSFFMAEKNVEKNACYKAFTLFHCNSRLIWMVLYTRCCCCREKQCNPCVLISVLWLFMGFCLTFSHY